MRNSVVKGLLAASLIGTLAMPALAQDGPGKGAGQICANEQPCGPARDGKGPARGGHDGGPRMGKPGPDGSGPGNPGLAMAQRLAGLETYIGITPAQAPAWRDYTNALLAFAEAGAPQHGQPPQGNPPQGQPPQGQPPKNQPPLLMAERMAEQAIKRGEKAGTLKSAAAALKAALTPDQLARLIAAEAPHRGPQGEGRGPDQRPDRPMPPQTAD